MTKAELITKRDATYRVQELKRCENCKHAKGWRVVDWCSAIAIRGRFVEKNIDPMGICDLHEPKRKEST